ncbi:MAG: 2,3-bisphosphoglycerate-independent phosphoglycerate mutase [Sedimentisphaerales bacterium]|nr:2,3-bisphosphoglycerate-independent phosphoglycerate mutase [Sedimentisphaerales bacterium]
MPENEKSSVKCRVRPFVLIIRDGWGYNTDPTSQQYDATRLANTPTDDLIKKEYAHCLIGTSGEDVGLPKGTMGNSEVGHQNMGAGRIVYQESMRLTKEIREGNFFKNKELLNAIEHCKKTNGKVHLIGLVSDAGVHSLLEHLFGLLELARQNNFDRMFLHALTDGRDTPPNSGIDFIRRVQAKMAEMGVGKIATIMGRFYGMDRDQRWERVERAYQCLRYGKGRKATNAIQAMQESYDNEVTDEFVEPVLLTDGPGDGQPLALIEDGDAVIFFNFRGDRPREITRAFVDDNFTGFDRGPQPDVYYICLTEYDKTIPAHVAFPKPPKMKNIVGEYWSQLGLKQFRCAETEKYAHVTFFFNDYTEPPYPHEDRQIVPSPKVRTYDLKPEMSAYEVTDKVLERLDSDSYDVMVINFANPDMVGHTGVMAAAIKAAETVDTCVGKLLDKIEQLGGSAIITADHGNLELMYDVTTHGPHTAHTTFPVPFIVFDKKYQNCTLRQNGRLADVIPTALQIMGLDQPKEMTGKTLIVE